jgi:hypothetical protein
MTTSLSSPDLTFSDTASQPDEQPLSTPKTAAATQPSNDLKPSELGTGDKMTTPELATDEKIRKSDIDAKTKISNLLKDKEQEWTAVVAKEGPLHLLDLPLDVLKEIVKEVNAGWEQCTFGYG